MVTGSILKPPKLLVHGLWIDILIKVSDGVCSPYFVKGG